MRALMDDRREAVAAIRERVGMLMLLQRDGVVMRRAGAYWMGLCPFHVERSGSFAVGSRCPDRGKCYGCGWSGDVFDYWRATRGCDFGAALEALGEIAGVVVPARMADGDGKGGRGARSAPRLANAGGVPGVREAAVPKPGLPRLRGLTDDEIGQLAGLRGLSVEGVELAARGARQVGACLWPQWEREPAGSGQWSVARDATVAWVVTDSRREVAQFRRLDGGRYTRQDGQEIKCWSKGSPTWPVGAADLEGKAGVLLVEGGADLLAGWHFVWAYGLHGEVGVVAMLGASNRIRTEALRLFAGKRVRIMMDADAAGHAAAGRWQGQLTEAGAVVEVFDLGGLTRADGEPVKDLNDLALCSAEVLGQGEIREGFLVWDF